MKFDDTPDFEVYIDNENRVVTSVEDYVRTVIKYV